MNNQNDSCVITIDYSLKQIYIIAQSNIIDRMIIMNKKMTILFVLFTCMVALGGCTSESGQSQEDSGSVGSVSDDDSGSVGSVSDAPGTGDASLTERERYSKLEAELACSLIGVEDQEAMEIVLNDLASMIEKYGFTVDDIERLRMEYEGDRALANMIIEEMKMMCPEVIDDMPVLS